MHRSACITRMSRPVVRQGTKKGIKSECLILIGKVKASSDCVIGEGKDDVRVILLLMVDALWPVLCCY
jgi:hypothetical protein